MEDSNKVGQETKFGQCCGICKNRVCSKNNFEPCTLHGCYKHFTEVCDDFIQNEKAVRSINAIKAIQPWYLRSMKREGNDNEEKQE